MVDWKAGMKAVLVDGTVTNPFWAGGLLPEIGVVYTVKFVGLNRAGSVCLKFHEFDDNYSYYNASRFRPVIERKTDIEIFTLMLKSAPSKVDA
jgi:hypothetical protein